MAGEQVAYEAGTMLATKDGRIAPCAVIRREVEPHPEHGRMFEVVFFNGYETRLPLDAIKSWYHAPTKTVIFPAWVIEMRKRISQLYP